MTFTRDAAVAASLAFLGVLLGLCVFGALVGGTVVWWWLRGTP